MSPGLVPTLAEREGFLAGAVNTLGQPLMVFDPNTGNPFPGNVIPQNRISPQATALLAYYPLPNFNPHGIQLPDSDRQRQQLRMTCNPRVNKMINTKNFSHWLL